MNIYVHLTQQFNESRVRAILAGGQAVVLHRLAIMSKDGDWILREDHETVQHVLSVLEKHGAHYRFGAPLDIRWLSGGWSAHLKFFEKELRVRTDFVTRPPRLDALRLKQIWDEEERQSELPCLGARDLAETKKTNREKDYVVIGELARDMTAVDDRILYSRSARDLMEMSAQYPGRVQALTSRRPVLATLSEGLDAVERALDAERRQMMHANEERLARYMKAAEDWARRWPDVSRKMEGLSLGDAHAVMVDEALNTLPFDVAGGLT